MNEYDFYGRLSRRSPGSVVFTSAYLTPLPLDRRSTVADLGCAFGHRATWVARSRCCPVHAFDRDTELLERTSRRSEEGGAEALGQLHQTERYDELDLEEGSLDLIMAEGLTFELDTLALVPQWARYLKPDGCVAVAALGRVSDQVSPELMAPIAGRGPLKSLEELHAELMSIEGFKLIHQVQLPPYAWEEHYQGLKRLVRGALRSGELSADHPLIAQAQADLTWYQEHARGRLFLQAFVLKRA